MARADDIFGNIPAAERARIVAAIKKHFPRAKIAPASNQQMKTVVFMLGLVSDRSFNPDLFRVG